MQWVLKKNEKKLALFFNFNFRHIDDVLSLNNCKFCDLVELEIKDTTNTDRSASYLDLHLKIDSEERLRTKLYVNRQYFNFPFRTFHIYSTIIWCLCIYIYISVKIRYARACGSYQDFLDRGLLLTRKCRIKGSSWLG